MSFEAAEVLSQQEETRSSSPYNLRPTLSRRNMSRTFSSTSTSDLASDSESDVSSFYLTPKRVGQVFHEEMNIVREEISHMREKVQDEIEHVRERTGEARRMVSAAIQTELDHMKEKTGEARRVVSAAVQAEMVIVREELRYIVGRIENAPIFLQFNQYIHGGYRLHVHKTSDCIISLFGWHNETINIWSHLIGFMIMVGYCYYTFNHIEINDFTDKVIFLLFFLGACAMFLLSSLYHLFNCHHDEHVFNRVLTCDYVGIFSMILGSCLSALHFCFYCFWIPRMVYQSIIATLVLCGVGIVVLPKFKEPKYHHLKVLFYICTVSFAALPLAHVATVVGFYDSTRWWILLGLYACGVAVYTTKFPECKFPGKFDTWFASHQLWHIFVLLAGLWHYHSILNLYLEISTNGGCKSEEGATFFA